MVSNQSKLEYFNYYCMLKTDFIYEKYLDDIRNVKLKTQLTRFRLCSHSLQIETGRYNGIQMNDRNANNETRILLNLNTILCFVALPILRFDANKIIANCPNIALFRNILASQYTRSIINVARFISESI